MSRSSDTRGSTRTPQPPAETRDARRPDWRWRTFPVFATFMAGLLVAALINGEPNNTAAAVLVWVAVIGCSYAFAHLLVVHFIVARGTRRRAPSAEDEQYEDVVVYPKR